MARVIDRAHSIRPATRMLGRAGRRRPVRMQCRRARTKPSCALSSRRSTLLQLSCCRPPMRPAPAGPRRSSSPPTPCPTGPFLRSAARNPNPIVRVAVQSPAQRAWCKAGRCQAQLRPSSGSPPGSPAPESTGKAPESRRSPAVRPELPPRAAHQSGRTSALHSAV